MKMFDSLKRKYKIKVQFLVSLADKNVISDSYGRCNKMAEPMLLTDEFVTFDRCKNTCHF